MKIYNIEKLIPEEEDSLRDCLIKNDSKSCIDNNFEHYDRLLSETKNILNKVANEYSSYDYNQIYTGQISCQFNKEFQIFLETNLKNAKNINAKTEIYFSVLKTALKIASDLPFNLRFIYDNYSDFNYLNTIIEEGIKLPLNQIDLNKFWTKLQKSNIDKKLITKIKIALQFGVIFQEKDILFGLYSSKHDKNGGCISYLNCLNKHFTNKANNVNPDTVAEIVRIIYSQKKKNTPLSSKLETIDKYFTNNKNSKVKPFIELRDALNWKRISKCMLQYCLDKDVKGHFILDDLDMNAVISKKTNDDGSHLFTVCLAESP